MGLLSLFKKFVSNNPLPKKCATRENIQPIAETVRQKQCNPATVSFERKQTATGSLATSYRIVVGGYDENMLCANAVKRRNTGMVTYILRCTQHSDQFYNTIIKWIERNYNISLFSVCLVEDYWDAWAPNAEASRYCVSFQIDDCKLELWQEGASDVVGLQKESGTDDFADEFVARLLHGVITEFETSKCDFPKEETCLKRDFVKEKDGESLHGKLVTGNDSVKQKTDLQNEDAGKHIGSLVIAKVDCFENDKRFSQKYTLSDNVLGYNVREIIEFFEANTAVMTECYCQSSDDDGHPLYRMYKNKNDLIQTKDLPSPYIRFCIHFNNVNTNEYAFSLEMYTNSNVVTYVVDKQKQTELIEHPKVNTVANNMAKRNCITATPNTTSKPQKRAEEIPEHPERKNANEDKTGKILTREQENSTTHMQKHEGNEVEISANDNSENFECLFDLTAIDETLKRNIAYMVQRETNGFVRDRKLYLLYAWQSAQGETHCIFANRGNENFCIYDNVLENGVIRLSRPDCFDNVELYSLEHREFLGKLFSLSKHTVMTEEIETNIWEGMMKIFPDYTTNKKLRKAIFEIYFPYSLECFVGAESYLNSGKLYKMLKPTLENGMMEFQTWKISNRGKENETAKLIDWHFSTPFPETKEAFLLYAENLFRSDVDTAMSLLPHKTIYIDNQDSLNSGSMLFQCSYRTMHVYQSVTDTSIVVLKVYSVYNGRHEEGGRMEGYTFNKTIEIPAEQYYWTDEELIAEYKRYFNQ